MEFTKEHLDTPISELEEGATNTETLREFIRNSEFEFYMDHRDLDVMNKEELNSYIDFLDDLWNK